MLPKGTRVKMAQSLKDMLNSNDCKDHVDEFGECEGIVGDPYLDWLENEVYWQPSNLHYLYDDEDLIIIQDGIL